MSQKEIETFARRAITSPSCIQPSFCVSRNRFCTARRPHLVPILMPDRCLPRQEGPPSMISTRVVVSAALVFASCWPPTPSSLRWRRSSPPLPPSRPREPHRAAIAARPPRRGKAGAAAGAIRRRRSTPSAVPAATASTMSGGRAPSLFDDTWVHGSRRRVDREGHRQRRAEHGDGRVQGPAHRGSDLADGLLSAHAGREPQDQAGLRPRS